ncbi:MAG TPA: hypothetical protein VL330_03280 [Actinomycetes bacterium]|nr:hypothetical protein [Actinomycetes bacterium]
MPCRAGQRGCRQGTAQAEWARRSAAAARIVAPAPAGQLLTAYRAAQAKLAVPWEYLAAIHLVETRMGRIGEPARPVPRG